MRLALIILTTLLVCCRPSSFADKKQKSVINCLDMSIFKSSHRYSAMNFGNEVNIKAIIENFSIDTIEIYGEVGIYISNTIFYSFKTIKGDIPPMSKRQLNISTSTDAFPELEIGKKPNLIFASNFQDTCLIPLSQEYVEYLQDDANIITRHDELPLLR